MSGVEINAGPLPDHKLNRKIVNYILDIHNQLEGTKQLHYKINEIIEEIDAVVGDQTGLQTQIDRLRSDKDQLKEENQILEERLWAVEARLTRTEGKRGLGEEEPSSGESSFREKYEHAKENLAHAFHHSHKGMRQPEEHMRHRKHKVHFNILPKQLLHDKEKLIAGIKKFKKDHESPPEHVDVNRVRRETRRIARVKQSTPYSYLALDDEGGLAERLEMERKSQSHLDRQSAALTVQYHLRSNGRYIYLEQFNDIGSRIDKHWFLVRDSSVKTERLLTLVPQSEQPTISFDEITKATILELFQKLQHPYVYPALHMDFKHLAEQNYIITILPYNNKGSLKDLIYRSRWQDDWSEKYRQRSIGLPLSQVQRLGRQILEALIFLQERGFPPFGHLHSGNVIIQNGVGRLSGLENTILGYTSRIYPVLKKRLKENRQAIDTICFGHVIFEMCAGYELSVPHPTDKHFEDIRDYPQIVAILKYIFENETGEYPTIDDLAYLEFFRNLDLRELRLVPSGEQFRPELSQPVRDLLRSIQRQYKDRGQKRSSLYNQPKSHASPEREPFSNSTNQKGLLMEEPESYSMFHTPRGSIEDDTLLQGLRRPSCLELQCPGSPDLFLTPPTPSVFEPFASEPDCSDSKLLYVTADNVSLLVTPATP